MIDPDRLAEIKAILANPRPPGIAEDPIIGRLSRADIDRLVNEVERLRDLLARLEWAGYVEDITGARPACPACNCEEGDPHGHEPGCWLVAALAGNDETPAQT